MVEQAEILMNEIRQFREQYVAEVGRGRRTWPRSIKERIHRLDEMGIPAKRISEKTGVGYDTILQWRYKRRSQVKKQFHQLEVAPSDLSQALVKVGTVTVPKIKMPTQKILKSVTVTVTTPDGFRLEAVDFETALALIRELRGTSCS
jgi:hypothetical protein